MNNYNYFDNFNDTFLNPNNKAYFPDTSNLFGPYEGYLRGNLFKNLYSEYKNYRPATLRFNSEQEEALFNLSQMGFAMHELNLYLDIHPEDRNMLNVFMDYKNTYNNLLNSYEQKYGPITVNGANGPTPFSWVNTTFPWEVN